MFKVPLLHIKLHHLAVLEITREMIVNLHRTHTSRSSRIEHVARLQCEELADETYQTVNPKQHVVRATLLDGRSSR